MALGRYWKVLISTNTAADHKNVALTHLEGQANESFRNITTVWSAEEEFRKELAEPALHTSLKDRIHTLDTKNTYSQTSGTKPTGIQRTHWYTKNFSVCIKVYSHCDVRFRGKNWKDWTVATASAAGPLPCGNMCWLNKIWTILQYRAGPSNFCMAFNAICWCKQVLRRWKVNSHLLVRPYPDGLQLSSWFAHRRQKALGMGSRYVISVTKNEAQNEARWFPK